MKEELRAVAEFQRRLDISKTKRLTELPMLHGKAHADVDSARADAEHWARVFEGYLRRGCTDPRILRAHLAFEELAEWLEAMLRNDELAMLDATADRLYVLLGDAVTFDLPLYGAFWEVHASNMTKQKQATDAAKERVRDKGPAYRPPDLAEVLRRYRQRPCAPKLDPIPDDEWGCLMTLEEWADGVKTGCFTSDDGSGYYATKDGYDNESSVWRLAPEWATHVLWFNK